MYPLEYVRVHVCTHTYTVDHITENICDQMCTVSVSISSGRFLLNPEFSGLTGRGQNLQKCTHMVAHGRVHVCTQSCTSEYTCVPSRIRHIYVRHICTLSCTTGYIYVLCHIRLGTYMYPVVYDWVHICTLSIRVGTCMYLLGVHLVR